MDRRHAGVTMVPTRQCAGRLAVSDTSGGAEELHDTLRVGPLQHLVDGLQILTAGALNPLAAGLQGEEKQ